MAIIHNAFLRSLNSIYLQAPHIKDPNDIKDFMVYVENWHDGLHQHHETEETIVFPLFAKDTGIKDIMEP
jgi:iron-sulfur cluster repair protein YtfE (RIC family)